MGTAEHTTLRERMAERELTPFQKGFILATQMIVHRLEPSIEDVADLLGYATTWGASRIIDRNDLPGVYFDEERKRLVFILDGTAWPY